MITANFDREKELWNQGYLSVAGLDEVGRGPLAGPVVVGIVIFPPRIEFPHELRDSKKFSHLQREKLEPLIRENARDFSLAEADNHYIDEFGIMEAISEAIRRAIINLKSPPEFLLCDAILTKHHHPDQQQAIIRGDEKIATIAAASIIAKVYRDRLMTNYHETYPQYGFDHHKGYGTAQHLSALKQHGMSPLHRKTFLHRC